MSRPVNPTSGMIVILHHAGGRWYVLATSPRNGGMVVEDSTSFGGTEEARLNDWVREKNPSRVIRVLPARSVICRSVQVPDAAPEDLASALDIQMETFLASAAPAHRRAQAIMPKSPEDDIRSGLLLAWPTRSEVDDPALEVSCPVTYAPDVAGLAGLLEEVRADEPIFFADREDGSVALALCHAPGVIFRASRETTQREDDFLQDTRLLIAETAMNAGRNDEQVDAICRQMEPVIRATNAAKAQLYLPASVRARVLEHLSGAPDNEAWWAQFGVAAGVALTLRSGLASLSTLHRDAPIEHPSLVERVSGTLSSQRVAAQLAIAAVLVLIIAPLAFAGARLLVLKQQVGDLAAFNRAQGERERQVELYRALRQVTWPMQKMLADLSNAAPPGLIFRSVNLNESTNKVDIQGEADSQLQVNEMVRRMLESGVFDASGVKSTFSNRDDGGKPSFTITASVVDAYKVVDWEQDFGETTLAMHLYPDAFERLRQLDEERGQRAAPPTAAPNDTSTASGTEGDDTGTSVVEATNTDGGTLNGGNDPFGRTGPRSVRPKADIPAIARDPSTQEPPKLPEMLSREEMDELSRQELVIKMVSVSNAKRTYPNLTDEQEKQLDEQFNLMREVLQSKPR